MPSLTDHEYYKKKLRQSYSVDNIWRGRTVIVEMPEFGQWGPYPRLGVTLAGWKCCHWIYVVEFPISIYLQRLQYLASFYTQVVIMWSEKGAVALLHGTSGEDLNAATGSLLPVLIVFHSNCGSVLLRFRDDHGMDDGLTDVGLSGP